MADPKQPQKQPDTQPDAIPGDDMEQDPRQRTGHADPDRQRPGKGADIEHDAAGDEDTKEVQGQPMQDEPLEDEVTEQPEIEPAHERH